jgi:acetyl esterase/lipase
LIFLDPISRKRQTVDGRSAKGNRGEAMFRRLYNREITEMALFVRLGLTALLMMAAGSALAAPLVPSISDIEIAKISDLGTDFALKANLYLPSGPKGAPTALVLYIHGKGGTYDDPKDTVVQRLLGPLLRRGIAVARIDYRRSGRMPDMLFDTKAYIRFFRVHAAIYNIDPGRIGIWGVSRGGNLAAMLAVTGDLKALEGAVGGNTDQPSRLQASVVESPLTDLFLSTDDKAAAMFGDYLGTDPAASAAIVAAYRKHDVASPSWKDVERIQQVNPLNYVNKASRPR